MNTAIEKAIPTILSVAAGLGVVSTGILAAKGHVRAIDILNNHTLPEDASQKEVAKEILRLTYKEYGPAVCVGAATIACIFASNGLHLKEEAALAAVVGVIGSRLKGMDKEVLKKYGKEALNDMRKDILEKEVKDRAEKIKKADKKKHDVDTTMYYEPYTEQFFHATSEQIKDAELQLNSTFQSDGCVTLAEFLRMLPKRANLVVPDWAGQIGWYSGDEAFEWNAAFSSGFISLNPTPMNVNGWDVNAIMYSIYPMEPGEDYIQIVRGEKSPYSIQIEEPDVA